jgi:molecular chaperone GrpE
MNDTEDTRESSKVQETEGTPIQNEATAKADAAAEAGNEVKKDEAKDARKGKEAKEEEKRAQKELDNSRKELENALKELEDVKKKSAETNDKYLRMVAEFDNYRRRTSKERLEFVATAGEDVIKGILPVLDDFEHALKLLGETNRLPENEGRR